MPRNTANTIFVCLLLLAFAIPAFANQSMRDDVIIEGFEGGFLPSGWTEISDHPNNWDRTNYKANSGTYSAYNFWSTTFQDNWLITPALDLSQLVNPKLEFFEDDLNWASNGGHHYIMYSTTSPTDPSAFSVISEMTPDNHEIPGFGNTPTTVDLLPAAGSTTVYIAFRYTGDPGTSDTWFVDDMRIYEPEGHDVEAISVVPDGVQSPGNELITPQVLVKNIGSTTETFEVELQIMQSGTVAFTEIVTVTDLGPGLQELADFPEFFLVAGEYYNLSTRTMLVGDINPENDSATGMMDTYTESHVPLGILWTNAGCMPCVQGNESLDDYMPGQGDGVALMRIHTSWPDPSDPMYQDNTAQSSELVSEFQIMGVPSFWVDAFQSVGSVGSEMPFALENAKSWKSPLTIDLTWDGGAENLSVSINTSNPIRPESELELFCSITEDNVEHTGPNGEPVHMQVFRRMWPGTSNGQIVPSSLGTHIFDMNCPLENWNYGELRATVYVRDMNTGKIVNAATGFLTNLEALSPSPELLSSPFTLDANYPNPFNPSTTISFNLESSTRVSLKIYDAKGNLIRTMLQNSTMSSGRHQAVWMGNDAHGESVPSGVYFYCLNTSERTETRKMVLIK